MFSGFKQSINVSHAAAVDGLSWELLAWDFFLMRLQLATAGPGVTRRLSWAGCPTWPTDTAGSGWWLLAGSLAEAGDWSAYLWPLCDLGSQNDSWVPRGCVPGVSTPGEAGGSCKSSYDLALEVMQHDFYHTLPVISKTQDHARLKGMGLQGAYFT